MNSNHVNIYDIMHICISVCYVRQLGQSHTFDALIFTKQTHFHTTFHSTQDVGWAGIDVIYWYTSIWLPYNPCVSGFDSVFTILYSIIVHPCTTGYYFCLFLFIALWIVFIPKLTICVLPVIIIVVSGVDKSMTVDYF